MKKRFTEQQIINIASAALSAAILELPWLSCKELMPQKAASRLIGYSNTTEYEQSHKVQAALRKILDYH